MRGYLAYYAATSLIEPVSLVSSRLMFSFSFLMLFISVVNGLRIESNAALRDYMSDISVKIICPCSSDLNLSLSSASAINFAFPYSFFCTNFSTALNLVVTESITYSTLKDKLVSTLSILLSILYFCSLISVF